MIIFASTHIRWGEKIKRTIRSELGNDQAWYFFVL